MFDQLLHYYSNYNPNLKTGKPVNNGNFFIKSKRIGKVEDIKSFLEIVEKWDNKQYVKFKNQLNVSCQIEVLVITIIYIQRIVKNAKLILDEYNRFPILWFTCILAHKYYHDDPISPDYLCNLGGFNFNSDKYFKVEIKLLNHLGWNLHISREEYYNFLNVVNPSLCFSNKRLRCSK